MGLFKWISLIKEPANEDILSCLSHSNFDWKEIGRRKKTQQVCAWENEFSTPVVCNKGRIMTPDDEKNMLHLANGKKLSTS